MLDQRKKDDCQAETCQVTMILAGFRRIV